MRIDVIEDYVIRLRDVFSGILLETEDGGKPRICMRDSGFEISIKDTSIKNIGKEKYFNHYVACDGQIAPIVASAEHADQLTESNDDDLHEM